MREIENQKNSLKEIFDLIEDEKKLILPEGFLNSIKDEIDKIVTEHLIVNFEDLNSIKKLKYLNSSKLISRVKDFVNNTADLNQSLSKIIKAAEQSLNEENLLFHREANKAIKILKFEDANFIYYGETKDSVNASNPFMNGFGLIKSETETDYNLGVFNEDNFISGIWNRSTSEYFIGDFKYEDNSNKNIKTSFDGLIINFNSANSNIVNVLLGEMNFQAQKFKGMQINYVKDTQDIQFSAGSFKDGKKNSTGFLTIKCSGNSNKAIIADYIDDILKENSDAYILDEFSLIRLLKKANENEYFAEICYDQNILYRGQFRVKNDGINDEKNNCNLDIIPVFHGEGYLIDFEQKLRYSGLFSNGIKEGKGILRLNMENPQINRVLEGEFKNDEFLNGNLSENGTLIIEAGVFDKNLILKKGKLHYDREEFYDGEFSDNKRHGHGNYRYENRIEYKGEWKNGLRDGQGTLILEDTEKFIKGVWKENKLVNILSLNFEKLN